MQLSANGIALEVEDHGPAGGEPLVLVMGLGMQLVAWPAEFVAMLVARGFRVIRFDNRDIGLSQRFDHLGTPNLVLGVLKHAIGLKIDAPYTLATMADDTAGLLDALGLASAHVCGASMGGMIAQQLAARHPKRVKSLTLMMTSSGARRLPGPTLRVGRALLARPKDPRSVPSIIEHYVALYKLIGSPGYPLEDDELQARLSESVSRSYRPQGSARQMLAIAADGDRSPLLPALKVPTQIIHGQEDPLVPLAAGRDLARKIAGAELDVVSGMGHDLPGPLWQRFVADIASVAGRA
ncbi:MAG TPA: alpha/beta hydrolase [Burkholderiaceae bacterium]|jgi:pimeloyl-ACP methyl ester carboxylesterase